MEHALLRLRDASGVGRDPSPDPSSPRCRIGAESGLRATFGGFLVRLCCARWALSTVRRPQSVQ